MNFNPNHMQDHLAIYDFYKARMQIKLPDEVVISAAGAETVKQKPKPK